MCGVQEPAGVRTGSSNAEYHHHRSRRIYPVSSLPPSSIPTHLLHTLTPPPTPPHPRSPKSSIDIPALQEDLSDVLASAAELSNTRAAKVVGYRSEQHASLDLGSFLVFFNESWRFVVGCEVICRRMIVGLRGAVVSQVRTSNTFWG
jgi:hypothetical protein